MGSLNPYKEIGQHRNTKKTTDEFIAQAKEVWGDKFDYSKTVYDGANKKVIITCPVHGDFLVKPLDFLHGHGCPTCGGTKRLDTDTFIKRANEKHGEGRYDYSLVDYRNLKTKVPIICHEKDANGVEHGVFYQTPRDHLFDGCGCPKCYKNYKKTAEQFEAEARKVHGDKYIYHGEYYGNKKPIRITCPIHGDFFQGPLYHLNGQGCPKCYDERRGETRKIGIDEFIRRAREIHGNKYDYSKVEYINARTKICIICPKHGEFWMTPGKHLQRGQGCPKCSESHLERAMALKLDSLNIKYIRQYRFDWLRNKSPMPLDFFIPELNTAIECQGDQHFRSYEAFGGDSTLESTQARDLLKYNLCRENGVRLLYLVPKISLIRGLVIYDENNTFTSIDKLIEVLTGNTESIKLNEEDLKEMVRTTIRKLLY